MIPNGRLYLALKLILISSSSTPQEGLTYSSNDLLIHLDL